MNDMEVILRTNNLCKDFKNQRVVNNVSITVRENSIYRLIGPNGAGKSTLLKMICGILKPTSGKIDFSNHKWSRNDLSYIGTLIETPPLYENLKVRAELLKLSDEHIREILEIVVLKNTEKKRAGQFSLGMKQLFLSYRFGIGFSLFFGVFESLQVILYSNITLAGVFRFIPFSWGIELFHSFINSDINILNIAIVGLLTGITLFLTCIWINCWEGRKKHE